MIPTPYLLPVREPVTGDPDDFGNATTTWVEHTWAVHGVAPGAMVEPGQPNRDLSLILYTVYGPVKDAPFSEDAEVMVSGEWLPVNGRPRDWTQGPWANPVAGVVVELRRAEG